MARLAHYLLPFLIGFLCSLYSPVLSDSCAPIRGNCSECLVTPGCAYCTSMTATGCFNNSLSSYCYLIKGSLNNCNAVGTSCVDHSDCDSCTANGCGWCNSKGDGYCFAKTGSPSGATLCGGLAGTWKTSCTNSSSGTGTVSEYGTVDPKAKCEQFQGSQCIGTVFYDVFVNATYGQNDMSSAAALLFAYSGLPGITDACRNTGTLMNCGGNFLKCQTLPNTNIAVSIPACRSLCEKFNSDCSSVLQGAGLTLDCSGVDGTTGTYKYPETSIKYMYQGQVYEFPCNDMVPSADQAGYYPNRLTNSGFEIFNTDNETAVGWDNVNIQSPYRVILDIVSSTIESNVMEISVTNSSFGMAGVVQTVHLNRTQVLPIRLGGTSRIETTSMLAPDNYKIWVDFIYTDGSTDAVSLSFPNGSSYSYLETVFTPLKPVLSASVYCTIVNLDAAAYFDNITLQERIPDVPTTYQCYDPLTFNPNWQEMGTDPCAVSCPMSYAFDDFAIYEASKKMYVALSWIGFILMLLTIATWLIFPSKRKYPERIVLWFAVSAGLVSFHGVLIGFYTVEETNCFNKFTMTSVSNSSLCVITGMLLLFGGTAGLCWWLCIAISTWAMIRFHWAQSNFKKLEKYFHIASRSFATINTVIPMAAGEMKAGIGSIGCWITTVDQSAYQWGNFHVWQGFFLIVAVVLIVDSARIISKVTRTDKKTRETYIRFGGFISLLFINTAFIMSYKFYTFVNQDQWLESLREEYASCH